MDGGNPSRLPAPRNRSRPRLFLVGLVALLVATANGAAADDSASLRPLARRYSDPAKLFEAEELPVDHVVVPAKAFALPPEVPPPIQFAVEEPPAFVTGPPAARPPLKAPLPPTHPSVPSTLAGSTPAASQHAVVAHAAPTKKAPVPQATLPRAPEGQAPPQVAVASGNGKPQSANQTTSPSDRRAFPFFEAEPPAFTVMKARPARPIPEPVPAQLPPQVSPPVPIVVAGNAKPQSATQTTSPSDRRAFPFFEAEPPAFTIMGTRPARPIPEPVPAQLPPQASPPVPIVVAPAESPSLMIPPPPVQVASQIPDTPAFVSVAEPLNITIGAVAMSDQPLPAPAPGIEGSPASSAAAQSGAPGSFGEVEKLGDAPPSNTLEFLRSQAILLKPGQTQFDWGLTYTDFDVHAALPLVNNAGTVVGVTNERERLQLMTIPFAVRYGICDGLQCYVNAPLGWSNTEVTTDAGQSITNNFVGVGDISAGFNRQIMKGCGAYVPDVIASVGFIAPTGHATFATSLLSPNSALGQGFWDITCSILAVHTIDPVVFYYGGGYVHRFDASFGNNLDVDPGQEFDYLFGVGFAINPWVTVSGTFIGNYLTRFGINDVSIPGSDLDLMRFRVSVTIVKDKHICEPFGEIGMTPDTPSRVGVTFTY